MLSKTLFFIFLRYGQILTIYKICQQADANFSIYMI